MLRLDKNAIVLVKDGQAVGIGEHEIGSFVGRGTPREPDREHGGIQRATSATLHFGEQIAPLRVPPTLAATLAVTEPPSDPTILRLGPRATEPAQRTAAPIPHAD